MQYRSLGKSDLKVPVVGLGGDTFGRDIDEQATSRIVDHALDLGVNYIDTADVYGWGGKSEENIGKAVKGKRDRFIIATKFGITVSKDAPQGAGGAPGLGSRNYIMKAVEDSLRRLGTDYIDVYQFHTPDSATPIEETLRAMDDLVRAGKVRFVAGSNFPAWELCEAMWVSKAAGLSGFVSMQSRYNLIDRHIEDEIASCCQAYGVSMIPWYPLAGGFLTGKYRRGADLPEGTRFKSNPSFYAWLLSDDNFRVLDAAESFASERGHSVAELALAWLLSHEWVSTVIAGVTKTEQVSANVKAAEWRLTPEEMTDLDRATGFKAYSTPRPRRYVLPENYIDRASQ